MLIYFKNKFSCTLFLLITESASHISTPGKNINRLYFKINELNPNTLFNILTNRIKHAISYKKLCIFILKYVVF